MYRTYHATHEHDLRLIRTGLNHIEVWRSPFFNFDPEGPIITGLIQEVICTSRDGDHFWRMNECYVRGSTIKYLRIPDEVIDMVKDENNARMKAAKVPLTPLSKHFFLIQ